LSRQCNGDEQGVRVAMVERDRRFRIQLVEDLADPLCLLRSLHGGQPTRCM
jgi:hypothetical protein